MRDARKHSGRSWAMPNSWRRSAERRGTHAPNRSSSGLARCDGTPGSAAGQAVLPHLAVEVRAVDAEPGRGLRDVPIGRFQRLADGIRLAPLDLAAKPSGLFGLGSGLEPWRQLL